MMWDLDDLAASSDLAREYGVSRATICNWSARYPDFPQPLPVTVGSRSIYSRRQVAEWVARNCVTERLE